MNQNNQVKNPQQETRTDLREVAATFVSEGIKAIASGGTSLGLTLQQLSLKGALKQGVKTVAQQGFKKTAQKAGKIVGQAAIGTAQKLDNQEDEPLEMGELGLALLTQKNKGRG